MFAVEILDPITMSCVEFDQKVYTVIFSNSINWKIDLEYAEAFLKLYDLL